jgi:anti-sigma regulatory factor (Ser/Thr protein kinase)
MLTESIPCDASAPSRARKVIAQTYRDLDDATLDDVELLTTELVTNSVRHDCAEPDARVELLIKQEGSLLRVGVKDGGSDLKPEVGDPSLASEGGRGLMLVEALADDWGAETNDGLLTWFSIDLQDHSFHRG